VCASIVGAHELIGAAMVAGAGKSVMLSEKKAQEERENDELREKWELRRLEREREQSEGVRIQVKRAGDRRDSSTPGHIDEKLLGACSAPLDRRRAPVP